MDADAGLAGRLVDDGLFGSLAVVHISAGEAPLTDCRWDAAFHDVRVVEFVQRDDARHRRRMDPPHVRFCRVTAGELVPVVPVGVPLAERVVARVAQERDEAGVDGVAAVEGADLIGHGVLLGA